MARKESIASVHPEPRSNSRLGWTETRTIVEHIVLVSFLFCYLINYSFLLSNLVKTDGHGSRIGAAPRLSVLGTL